MSHDSSKGASATSSREGPTIGVQTDKVFKWWDYPIFTALSSTALAAIVYFFSYWFTLAAWGTYPAVLAVITVIFAVNVINYQGRWFLLLWMRKPRPMPPSQGWRIAVVTTFVPDAEPIEMLGETVRALVSMDYPHDTWVLDEGDDAAVKTLCGRLGAHHFTRKHLADYQTGDGLFRSKSKHGNYNAWLYLIGFDRYDIITAFDPDHVPTPSFLTDVLGYFNDPSIAYVQAAQAYYNQWASFIARGAAEETYAYYSSIQMAGHGTGCPVVIGCHNTHRVSALKQVGGFPAHDADDLLITLLYRSRGWRGVYVPRILAKGLTPVDWPGYLGQQRRWARSVLDLKIRHYPKLSSDLPLKTRLMGLLHGLNYVHRGVLIPAGLSVIAFMLATGAGTETVTWVMALHLAVLMAAMHLCELYRKRFYLDPNERVWHWRAGLLQWAKWPYLLFAVFEVLVDRRLPYALTPKVKARTTIRRSIIMWPHVIVMVIIGAAWSVGWMTHGPLPPFLHLITAAVLGSSFMLLLTETWTYPNPYAGANAEVTLPTQPLRRASFTEVP